jgi:hypothetical protein
MRLTDPRNGQQITLDNDLAERWAREFSNHTNQECDHKRQELRRGKNKAGMPVIRMQCLECGLRVGDAVKKPANAEELPEFEDAMQDAYRAERKAARDKIDLKFVEVQLRRWNAKERGDSYYRQAHQAYLDSKEWRRLRELVMRRAQGACEGCGLKQAKEVHHLSYEHWGLDTDHIRQTQSVPKNQGDRAQRHKSRPIAQVT